MTLERKEMQGFNLSRWAVNRPTLVLFLMLAIGLSGLISYQKLGRAEDPSFTIKIGIVTAFWPGSTAKEMRDQVADLMEKKLQELPFLDKLETYTKPGFLAISVTFKDTTPPRDVPGLFYQLRKKLHDVGGYLPQGVSGPFVNDEFGDVNSVLYAVSGEGADYHQLNAVVEVLRQRLLQTPDATKVDVYGDQDRKIFVEFSQAKLANLRIAPLAIFKSVAKQNAVTDAGVFETSSAQSQGASHGFAAGRAGDLGPAHSRRRAGASSRRHRHHHAGLSRSPGFSRSTQRDARDHSRSRDGQGRQRPHIRQESRSGS